MNAYPDLDIRQADAPPDAAAKLAPHSIDGEEAVLGSILINPDSFVEIAVFLRADDFFIFRHGLIWQAMEVIHIRNEAVDDLTVIDELRVRGQLDEIGGAAYITRLINNTPTHIHVETYGRLVERAAKRRALLAAASEIAQLAQSEELDIDAITDKAESVLAAAIERRGASRMTPLSSAAGEYFSDLEERYTHKDMPPGVPTGFTDLDALLGGMQKSDLVIVAARPGVGKTSLMLSMALNAARMVNARIGMFSLEMNTAQLVARVMAAETGINSQRLRMANIDDQEWGLVTVAVDSVSRVPMCIDDTPGLTLTQLRATCRRLKREGGLDLIVVDYLQLMGAGGGERSENRVQEIGAISRGLKEIAREFNVPVLAAAQLSRQVEQRADKRPLLSDLRESGSIEADADVVMFIYRDDVYNENSERPNQADIIVAKDRNGPTGAVSLYFDKGLTRFSDLKRRHIDIAPDRNYAAKGDE